MHLSVSSEICGRVLGGETVPRPMGGNETKLTNPVVATSTVIICESLINVRGSNSFHNQALPQRLQINPMQLIVSVDLDILGGVYGVQMGQLLSNSVSMIIQFL